MDAYVYPAKLIRCIDGDTVVLNLDMGFYQWRINRSYRLLRINAPELNTPEGKTAKAALEGFLNGKVLVARTHKADDFGRFLVELYADDASVSDWMLASGNAVPMAG